MGLLTGEPLCSEDPITGCTEYCGPVVDRAASVKSAANGGQIVVAESTWEDIEPFLHTLEASGGTQAIHLGEFGKETLVELKPSGLLMRSFSAPSSTVETSPVKVIIKKMTRLTKANEELKAKLSSLWSQLECMAAQSHALKRNLACKSQLFLFFTFSSFFFLLKNALTCCVLSLLT